MRKSLEENKSSDEWKLELGVRLKKAQAFAEEFKAKTKLNLMDYFSPLLGLNVVKLDEALKTPKGKSLAGYIEELYGKTFCDIIKELI